jgi:hypothetical protein
MSTTTPSKINTEVLAALQATGLRVLGRMKTRHARQIAGSPWGIGCETLDRGYVDFHHTGPHLGDLGAKRARLQAGWARCEPKADGRYDWAWLDEIVNSCVEQGVTPWLQPGYGNQAYPGGGGIGLAEGIPSSDVALAAWDRWVRALAERYSDRVSEWEVWNEPDNRQANTPDIYTAFFIRTARIIRSIQPRARIIGLGLAGSLQFAEAFVRGLRQTNKADLLDEITFHFYPHNPDGEFDRVAQLRATLDRLAPHVALAQGETGAPSETRRFMALGDYEWNERKQAAWNLRRLLAHHARGYRMSLFQLADMQYAKGGGAKFEGRNSKGLLCINPDKTVAYRKPSYHAAQHVFSLLDDRFPLVALPSLSASEGVSAHLWKLTDGRPAMLGWWRSDDAPALKRPGLTTIALDPVTLRQPLLLDFLSGALFEPPAEPGDRFWSCLPCGDTPLALVERSLLELREDRR